MDEKTRVLIQMVRSLLSDIETMHVPAANVQEAADSEAEIGPAEYWFGFFGTAIVDRHNYDAAVEWPNLQIAATLVSQALKPFEKAEALAAEVYAGCAADECQYEGTVGKTLTEIGGKQYCERHEDAAWWKENPKCHVCGERFSAMKRCECEREELDVEAERASEQWHRGSQ